MSIFSSVYSLKDTSIVNSLLQRLSRGVGVLSSSEYSLSLAHSITLSLQEPTPKPQTAELLKQYQMQAQVSLCEENRFIH